MQFTKFSDYALRVLMYSCAAQGRLVTIEEMAGAYRISRAHLMKVVSALTRSGHLEAVRGRSGGVRLGRDPSQIGLGDVIRATEPDFAIVECFGHHNKCVISRCCKLPSVLDEAMMAFLSALDRRTLADIALNEADAKRLLPRGKVLGATSKN